MLTVHDLHVRYGEAVHALRGVHIGLRPGSGHTDPKNGTVTTGPDGKFTYKPKDGFTGDDSFGYTVTDPYGQQATAKVTITVKTGGTAPAPQGSSGGLAATGASVVGLTAAAVGLLGLGGGLIAFTARRRRRRPA